MQRWRGQVDDSGEFNRAVLVSVAQFVPGVGLGRRPGADKDTKTLHRTLSKLGFKVDIHSDLSGDEIYQLFLSILLSFPLFLPSVLSSGYGAFMHPLGSVFLQTFCTLLKEDGNRNLELTRLMTRLSHRVAYSFQAKGGNFAGKKEMPCLVTRLTREVFPFAEPGKDSGAAGLSATSLLDTQHVSTRTPSIS